MKKRVSVNSKLAWELRERNIDKEGTAFKIESAMKYKVDDVFNFGDFRKT